jgi:hypothetical protein
MKRYLLDSSALSDYIFRRKALMFARTKLEHGAINSGLECR